MAYFDKKSGSSDSPVGSSGRTGERELRSRAEARLGTDLARMMDFEELRQWWVRSNGHYDHPEVNLNI